MGDLGGGIVENATFCQSTLARLADTAKNPNPDVRDLVRARDVEHLRDRFDQWAGNLGALQPPSSRVSLEYRLRNNPIVKDAILKLLSDLHESLQAARDIATGSRNNRTAGPLIDSDNDLSEYDLSSSGSDSGVSLISNYEPGTVAGQQPTSEINELLSAIKLGIDSLFKASLFIRKFSSNDKRQRASKTTVFDNRADIMYIKDRYPSTIEKNKPLVARLGEANARRRQYFKYCRDHNDRLSHLERRDAEPEEQGQQSQRASQPADQRVKPSGSTLPAQTRPSILVDTEATELVADGIPETELTGHLDATPAMSVVSFATSVVEMSENNLAFPPLPTEAVANSMFICPFCFTAVSFKQNDKTLQWRKHVLEDLEPYICTFPTCGLETYKSQHTWFEHELLMHRNHWSCPLCSESFPFSQALDHHIAERHRQEIPLKQTAAIIELSKRPLESIRPSECPFCDDEWASVEAGTLSADEVLVVGVDQFRKHVGHHMQQIALFSLPRLVQEQETGSNEAGAIPDRDAMSVGYKWVRDDYGRGWSVIASKRATFIAFASILGLYKANRSQFPTTRNLSAVDPARVPAEFKVVGDDWHVIYNSEVPRSLKIHLADTVPAVMFANIRFSDSGSYIASTGSGEIQVFKANTNPPSPVCTLQSTVATDAEQRYNHAAFSPEEKFLASGQDNGTVKIWNLETATVIHELRGHEDTVLEVRWSSDGEFIASASSDGTVRLWDAETATCGRILKAKNPINSAAISGDCRLVAGGGMKGCIDVWDRFTGDLVARLGGPDGHATSERIWAVAFLQDSTKLLTAGSDNVPRKDQPVKLWDLTTSPPKCIRTFLGQTSSVRSIAATPDSKYIISGSVDGSIMVWDADTGEAQLRVQGHDTPITGSDMCLARQMIATSGAMGEIRLWTFSTTDPAALP